MTITGKAQLRKVRVPFRKSRLVWVWTDTNGIRHQVGIGTQLPRNGAVETSTGERLDLHTGELYRD